MAETAPIGVFDSGLGGLTVMAALARRLPGQGFLYLGDNAAAPYGVRAAPEIEALTRRGVERLFDHGCRLVVLACNTASAVALRPLQQAWLPRAAPERRVLGVFVPLIEALCGRPWGYAGPPAPARRRRLLLFATPATVASGAFERELGLRATGVRVTAQPCPGLVEALEAGDRAGAASLARRAVAAALRREPAPDGAALGCTHYPLLKTEFRAALPHGVEILDQARLAAESLADYLRRHPRFAGASGPPRLMTTGEPDAVGDAAAALGIAAGAGRVFAATPSPDQPSPSGGRPEAASLAKRER